MPTRHATLSNSSSPDSASPRRVGVLLPLPLGAAYDYRVPADMKLTPGDFVAVPLGGREVNGVVWGGGDPAGVADNRLRDVAGLLDAPSMPKETRALVDWVAGYTLAPRGAVLRMAMSVPAALRPPTPIPAYAIADPAPEFRMTPARQRILAVLAGGPPRPGADLAREAAVGAGVVSGLAKAGALVRVSLPADGAADLPPDPGKPGPKLSTEQKTAADALAARTGAGYCVTLLDGVTGSGKTEVYFEAIAAALESGRQALVLLPEIALTGQWLTRFADRFGAEPELWHSELAPARRRRTWRRIALGQARVVVGARSALFLPFGDLGLIVVDEEHDPSYKQE
ncbi:MAG: DEAD/DEAH box helicase, partial [Alphaproteobacteria bacterium]